jgi:DNA-directed RNA polymerase specialized sigma24 family protein
VTLLIRKGPPRRVDYAEARRLREVERMTYVEIAAHLDISTSTAHRVCNEWGRRVAIEKTKAWSRARTEAKRRERNA